MKKVLVLRFSSIGDIVLTTPVIRAIKQQWPEPVELHFLCKEAFREVLDFNPYIDKLWTFDKKPSEITEELRAQGFDLVVDLQHNRKTLALSAQLGAPVKRVNKLNIRKWLLVNLGWDMLPDRHVVERYMDTVRGYGVMEDGKGADFFPSPGTRSADQIRSASNSPYALFALGGAHLGKRLSNEQWTEVARSSTLPVILVGGPSDVPDAQAIELQLPPDKVLNLCGKLSLSESALLARDASVVLTGDTGMMHIAAAFRQKIVSVWGCTVPKFGMYPYLPHPESVILEPLELKKRPCSKLGNRCKYGMEHRCITHLDAKDIALAVNRIGIR